MALELARPLAFIDRECTGTSPERDRIVEIAVLKLHPNGREEMRLEVEGFQGELPSLGSIDAVDM